MVTARSAGELEPLDESLTGCRECDHTTAPLPPSVAQGEETIEEGGAESAGEMHAAFAPIQARTAERPPPRADSIEADTDPAAPGFPRAGERHVLIASADQASLPKSIQQVDTGLSREVVVADPRVPEIRIPGPWANPLRGATYPEAEAHEGLEDVGDLLAGDPEIAMPALFRGRYQPGRREARQVTAGGRLSDAGLERELARGARAAVHERGEHPGPAGICYQRGAGGEVGYVDHSTMLTKVCPPSQAEECVHS